MSSRFTSRPSHSLTRFGIACCTLVLYATTAYATEWQLDKSKSQLLFKAGGLVNASGGFHDYDAEFKGDILADPTHVVVHATVNTSGVYTGSSMQDQILKGDSFFNARQFPKAEFNSSQIIKHDLYHYSVLGTLTIRGISKPVTFEATFEQPIIDPVTHVTTLTSHGSIVINRDDWGMDETIPGVSNEITLSGNTVIHSIP